MCPLQSISTIDSNPIETIWSDDVVLAFAELIRRALRENPVLTQEQLIHETFEVNEININQNTPEIITFIFWCVQHIDNQQ